jgi:hypothetical protein
VITLQAEEEESYSRLTTALAVYAVSNTVAEQKVRQQQDNLTKQPVPQAQQKASSKGIVLNSDDVVVFEQGSADLAKLGGEALENQLGQQTARGQQQIGGVQTQVQNRVQQQMPIVQNNGFYNDTLANNLNTLPQSIQQATAKGGPFRISLTHEQVDEIAKAFRVTVLARGNDAYQFRTVGDRVPAGWDARDRSILLARAGVSAQEGETQVAGARGGQGPQGLDQAAAAASLIDCVIIMEPPTPANPR